MTNDIWTTAAGESMHIKDMTTQHPENVKRHIEERYKNGERTDYSSPFGTPDCVMDSFDDLYDEDETIEEVFAIYPLIKKELNKRLRIEKLNHPKP